eukprot:scaffold576_cov260-Pinguiococcus_pyrenoidosus.AAC.63
MLLSLRFQELVQYSVASCPRGGQVLLQALQRPLAFVEEGAYVPVRPGENQKVILGLSFVLACPTLLLSPGSAPRTLISASEVLHAGPPPSPKWRGRRGLARRWSDLRERASSRQRRTPRTAQLDMRRSPPEAC